MNEYILNIARQSIIEIGHPISYWDYHSYIRKHYDERLTDESITRISIAASVNHDSRVHYSENNFPRLCNQEIDFLYLTGDGKLTFYNPEIHGIWEIYPKKLFNLGVRRVDSDPLPKNHTKYHETEKHLFILKNELKFKFLEIIQSKDMEERLYLYENSKSKGMDVDTGFGTIDLIMQNDLQKYFAVIVQPNNADKDTLDYLQKCIHWLNNYIHSPYDAEGIYVASDFSEIKNTHGKLKNKISFFKYNLSVDFTKE